MLFATFETVLFIESIQANWAHLLTKTYKNNAQAAITKKIAQQNILKTKTHFNDFTPNSRLYSNHNKLAWQ